jgi:hypothetical protein
MRYASTLSGNFFSAGAVSVNVLNSPGATVIVASQVGNSVGFGGDFGFSPLSLDVRGFPGF